MLCHDPLTKNASSNRTFVYYALCFLAIVLAAVSIFGCSTLGDVPSELQVDYGNDPDKQDSNVRFKTTYYFRIVDSCRVEGAPSLDGTESQGGVSTSDASKAYTHRTVFNTRYTGKLRIVNDSLYRFRMVGKASALFSNIHFESGVLRAEQIDPFGTATYYDTASKSYRVESASALRLKEKRKAHLEEFEDLLGVYKSLKGSDLNLYSKLENEIETILKKKIRYQSGDDEATSVNDLKEPGHSSCPDGRPARRSYLLYGPEGVREVDPDERLLMAMSSDSKPLVSLLQQLSEKHLLSHTEARSELKALAAKRALIFRLSKHLITAKINLVNEKQTFDSRVLLKELIAQIKNQTGADKGETLP